MERFFERIISDHLWLHLGLAMAGLGVTIMVIDRLRPRRHAGFIFFLILFWLYCMFSISWAWGSL